MSSSGNFNSEFDTYLLTSVKYGVQRRGLYKEFSTAMFMGPAAAHKWARFGLVSIRKGRPAGERAASYPPLPREAGALRLSRAGLTESTEGEFFLIMLQPFHSPCLLQLLLPNNTLSSVTADVPSLLWSPRPAYTDSHTLAIIPHCVFLSHLFPCLCFFTAPQWARFFSGGGSTLLKLRRSPVYMMSSAGDSPCSTAMKTSLRCLGSSRRPVRPITRSPFKPGFPPATSKRQLILLMTHPRGFYKGQMSGLSQEEKQPWCCESEPQSEPCPWRSSAGPLGALPGPVACSCPLNMMHTFHQNFTPQSRLAPARLRWSHIFFSRLGIKQPTT